MPAFALLIFVGILLRASHTKAQVAGPVVTTNFPDPSIINFSNQWYAFVTGTTVNVPFAISPDFNTWTVQTNSSGEQQDTFPVLPPWVSNDPGVWAPDVNRLEDGSFVMYYCAAPASSPQQHCVGAATSSTIDGPYTSTSSTPLFCPLSQGGAIDASGFSDSTGQRYVVYKVDGNSLGHGGACNNDIAPFVPTPIMLQPVAADGITLDGTAIQILDNNGTMDDGIIEAPVLIEVPAGFILFFSSGCYTTTDYTVSYATATSVTGPYIRQGGLLVNGDFGLNGPGGADISAFGGGYHMLFHGNVGSNRELYTGILNINGLTVSI